MKPKNSKDGINWGPTIVVYLLLLYVWLHFCHLTSWCNGTYTDKFISIMGTDNAAMFLGPDNWPIKVISFENRLGMDSINLLMYGAIEAFTDPFNLQGTVLADGVLGLILISVFFLAWSFSDQLRHRLYKQDAAGKEYGSAAWKTLDDINEFTKTKAEFYWRDYATSSGKPNLELKKAALLNSNVTTPDCLGGQPLKGKEALELFHRQKDAGIEDPNIILGITNEGKYLKYSMDNKYTGFNVSEVLVGSAGKGKTFKHIKPLLAQMNSSFIVTDPSGEIMADMGMMLLKNGYKVKLFSTSDMDHTDCYNPFDYIYGPDGVTVDQTKVGIMVSTFLANADETKKGAKGGDDFWKKAPQAFLMAAVYFCVDFMPVEQRNMATIFQLTKKGKTDEASSSSKTELDKIFEAAKRENPRSKCFEHYGVFKLAPAKTANSILISLGVDLTKFADDAVRNMTSTDYLCKRDKKTGLIKEYLYPAGEKKKPAKERRPIRSSHNIDLDKIGDEKTAVFINIPQANAAYNFLVSMMYAQLFDVLYSKAENVCPERYHIYDAYGAVLSSQYETEEKALRTIELFGGAEVKEEEKNGVMTYYIYNEAADASESLPECSKGYLKEVFSAEVGKKLINAYKTAKPKKGARRLPIHVKCLLDEFANIGAIPDFEKIPATSRKYEISCVIVIQSFVQLEQMYDKAWETLIGNCSTITYLGSTEYKTQEYISKLLGKATIRTVNESMSKQTNGGSASSSFQRMGRDLMTIDEVGSIKQNEEIVLIDGQRYFVKKLDFSKHPHFKESGSYNKANELSKQYLEEHYKNEDKRTLTEGEDDIFAPRLDNVKNGGTGLTVGTKGAPPFGKTVAAKTKSDIEKGLNMAPGTVDKRIAGVKSVEKTEEEAAYLESVAKASIPGTGLDISTEPKKKITRKKAAKTEVVPSVSAEAPIIPAATQAPTTPVAPALTPVVPTDVSDFPEPSKQEEVKEVKEVKEEKVEEKISDEKTPKKPAGAAKMFVADDAPPLNMDDLF